MNAGQTATFSVVATGTPAPTYQWSKNGSAISGATAASYTTPALTSTDNGASFTVAVSNAVASVTSSAATVTIAATGSAQATFVATDATTQGNWQGKYGSDGYALAASVASLPAYAVSTPQGNSTRTWTLSSNDRRALLKPNDIVRVLGAWNNAATFNLKVDLTGTATRQVALYLVDWDGAGVRQERIDVLDTATSAVLDSRTFSAFNNGVYAVWNVSGNVTFRVQNLAGTTSVVSGIFFAPVAGAPVAAAATYVTTNRIPKGSWRGAYGSDGSVVIGQSTTLPSYAASVAPSGQTSKTWASITADLRALQYKTGNNRIAAAWNAANSFDVLVGLKDGQPHQVGLYVLGWTATASSQQTIDAIDPVSGAVLDSRTISAFDQGAYVIYTITGRVSFRFRTVSGSPNAALSGVFFDPVGTVPMVTATATFTKTDLAAQGTWRPLYGNDGYIMVGGGQSLPAYATVTPSGATAGTWVDTTTDVRALLRPIGTDRFAGFWKASSSFDLDVNLSDGQPHQIALYGLDWTGGNQEVVEIRDAATDTILDSRSLTSFASGTYLVWKISGHVTIRVRNLLSTGNALVSGLFFDPALTGPG